MYTDLLQLENELDEFLYNFGYQVVDLQSAHHGARTLFRLFVDRVDDGPVTLGDLGALSPQVVLFLEQKGVYGENGSLEVSSAGLDRLLKRERDYVRFLGAEVRVTFHTGPSKQTIEGELASFSDDVLVIAPGGKDDAVEALRIERASIECVRLVPQWSFK